MSLDDVIRRLEAIHETTAGVAVTPETCMQSPTVHAIVTAISRRISTLPVHVYRKKAVNGRTVKEMLPSHPVAKLLQRPNDWQSRSNFWLDAVSRLIRYGNFYAYKARGATGPVRRLLPLDPAAVKPVQDNETWDVQYRVTFPGGRQREHDLGEIFHIRGAARDALEGDSPIMDVREEIALEIAASRMGASFFGNGAMPSLIFQFAQGAKDFKTDEERKRFIEDFHRAYSGRGRFKAMLLPKGIEKGAEIQVEADKAQFLQTRQYQRTVIAGAFGVPPHLVGDLTKMTFGNVEQQSIDFVQSVVLPYCQMIEAAIERDLLTPEDRANGVIVRFNLEAALRGDFKSQQEALRVMRDAGVISPNDWREYMNMNPISPEDGGDDYWRKGPSGQSAEAPDDTKPNAKPGDEPDADEKEPERPENEKSERGVVLDFEIARQRWRQAAEGVTHGAA